MAGFLNIISERMSGTPHAACLFEYESRQKWFGWVPGYPTTPYTGGAVGPGCLDTNSREADIAYFASFRVTTNQLWLAEDKVKATYYDGSGYKLYLRDCISLMIDACSWCGLSVPQRYPVPTTLSQFARNVLTPKIPLTPISTNMPMTPNVFPHELFFKIVRLNPGALRHFGTEKDQPYPWN